MGKSRDRQASTDPGSRSIVRNRKARHDYEVSDTLEAGIALVGSEVKSLREGRISLVDAYGEVKDGELWLVGAEISEYVFANQFNHPTKRRRKLLAHRDEIRRLGSKVQEKGVTLVPLELYFKKGRVKVLLGVGRGRRQYDHREAARRRDQARDLAEEMAGHAALRGGRHGR
jgi:SsrA-binding protein